MSGRVRWLRDGQTVTGYRKTDRRQSSPRPMIDRLHDINRRGLDELDDSTSRKVSVVFLLPAMLRDLVALGPQSPGIIALGQGYIRITGHSTEQCFEKARDFFADVARDRAGFTMAASVIGAAEPGRSFGRHMTVISGNLVVSAGVNEPRLYEAKPR